MENKKQHEPHCLSYLCTCKAIKQKIDETWVVRDGEVFKHVEVRIDFVVGADETPPVTNEPHPGMRGSCM